MADTKLKDIRTNTLHTTQEVIARRTSLSFSAYHRAETGKRVTYATATEILKAVNGILEEQGKQSITLEDLGLRLL